MATCMLRNKAHALTQCLSYRPYLRARLPCILAQYSSSKPNVDLDQLLSEPTWSVNSLLAPNAEGADTPAISSKQLHHLLRLSALPLPSSPEEESEMLKTLTSQLHFVREIQQVNTEGVPPLRALRDETTAAEKEQEISMDTLKEALAQEEVIGKHHKRIRRKTGPVNAKDAEDWDVLGYAERKAGKYFVVDSGKS